MYSWLNQANFTQTPKLFLSLSHLIKWKAWVMGDMLCPRVSLYFSSLPSFLSTMRVGVLPLGCSRRPPSKRQLISHFPVPFFAPPPSYSTCDLKSCPVQSSSPPLSSLGIKWCGKGKSRGHVWPLFCRGLFWEGREGKWGQFNLKVQLRSLRDG